MKDSSYSPGRSRWFLFALLFLTSFSFSACDSGDLLDLAFDPPSRKPIDTSKVAVNNFFVNPEFGSIAEQFGEIRDTLKIRRVRILLAWTDGVQASPGDELNYSFYDSIISQIPPGVGVVAVLAHTPSWMSNSANWSSSSNPRLTFVDRWVRPTVQRYAGVSGIEAWEVWNEPDAVTVPSDGALNLTDPANYAEMMAYAYNIIKDSDPSSLAIMAASQSIQQNFPTNLNYNKQLKDLGLENVTDVWNVHYYGTRFESVVTSNGVADFLNGVSKPIWVTESGQQGPNEQLAYVETAWPFLTDKIPGIQRFYYYQFGGTEPADVNYGLRTTDPAFPVSDLYIYLRDH
jgi:hypothetical protein